MELIMAILVILVCLYLAIQMELSFHSCDGCGQLNWKITDYGYAGMNYCKKCSRKNGY